MKEILKTLFKYKWTMLIIVILLFMQAYCNLALPSYTSDIINVGIEESGITSIVPEKIRVSEFNKLDFKMKISLDKSNSKLNLISDDDVFASFDYKNDYIEYDNENVEINDESVFNNFAAIIYFEGIMETLFNLIGYKDMTLKYDELGKELSEEFYNTYGFYIKSEPYEYTDENGSTSGDFCRYLKLSLDSEKISKLVEKYGVDVNDGNVVESNDKMPTISVDNITTDSITVYATVNSSESDMSKKFFCAIYRSSSADGEYELVSDFQVNCSDGVGFVDTDLQSGTTYYYKAITVGGSKYSDVISATTLNNDVKNDKNVSDNPKTGLNKIYFAFGCGIISLIMSIIILIYHNKVKSSAM